MHGNPLIAMENLEDCIGPIDALVIFTVNGKVKSFQPTRCNLENSSFPSKKFSGWVVWQHEGKISMDDVTESKWEQWISGMDLEELFQNGFAEGGGKDIRRSSGGVHTIKVKALALGKFDKEGAEVEHLHFLGPRDEVMETIIALCLRKITGGGRGLNHKLIRVCVCMAGRRRLIGFSVVAL